jgi:Arc/MetJ-type ribon-helix-helix transcriptional regulator
MGAILTTEQQKWLEAEVAAGHFPSVEDAVRIAVADMKAASTADLGWVKPYLDEARAAASRGATITLAEHRARMAQRLQR